MHLPHFTIALLFAAAFALPACSEHSDGDGHDHGQDPTAQHGKPGAAAGSYEDWCAEHEVPESRCTLCDPALAAAFKATGDWCAEHGLPESQCVACDPGRKAVRPPKQEGQ